MKPAAGSGASTGAGASAGEHDTMPPGEELTLSWRDPHGGLLKLSIFNFTLRILTLGIYHFWGKTEVRKRIWSSMRLQGEPFEYTGTGWEMFKGFVVVFLLVLLPLALFSFGTQLFVTSPAAQALLMVPLYAVIFTLIGMGTYRAQRYRLSRTRWRGIRGSLTNGKSFKYAMLYIGTALLIPMTMGWIIPWRETVLQGFMTNETSFGNRPLRFTADAGPLYKRYWVVWLAAIVAYVGGMSSFFALFWEKFAAVQRGVPLSYTAKDWVVIGGIVFVSMLFYLLVKAWYSAGLINYFAAHTWYGRARFKGRATALSLVWLTFTNFLMTVATLGALAPVAQARFMRYYVSRLEFDGLIPLDRVGQNEDALEMRGEGLATAFDIDAFG